MAYHHYDGPFLGEEIMENLTGFGLQQHSPMGQPLQQPQYVLQQQQQLQQPQSKAPYVEILEQPAENKLRFR